MSTGTRILLALGAVVGAVVLLYYASYMTPPSESAAEPILGPAEAVTTPAAPVDRIVPSSGARDPMARVVDPMASPATAERFAGPTRSVDPMLDRLSTPVSAPPIDETTAPATGTMTESAGPRANAPAGPRTADGGGALRANDPVVLPRPTESLPPATCVVRPGDSLYAIAARELGDGLRWRALLAANPGVDPQRLAIGQVLTLPAPAAARAGSGETWIVRDGDTLSQIAFDALGSAVRWREIWEANRARIGANPDELEVGMQLVLPAR